jgi:small subunit ribosomal protein S1
MEELLATEGYKFKGFKKGDAVHGKVASISGKQVLIDFGGKTEGVVGEKEWDQVKNFVSQLKPGDEIDAIVISTENNMGQMAVSIRQSGAKFRWQRADELLKSGEEVKVRGLEVNKGGLVVESTTRIVRHILLDPVTILGFLFCLYGATKAIDVLKALYRVRCIKII